jgi:RP/EB family microtubule-associated protein
MDMVYQDLAFMQKINWQAKLEYEFINNFKLLQSSFIKNKIKKRIDVFMI